MPHSGRSTSAYCCCASNALPFTSRGYFSDPAPQGPLHDSSRIKVLSIVFFRDLGKDLCQYLPTSAAGFSTPVVRAREALVEQSQRTQERVTLVLREVPEDLSQGFDPRAQPLADRRRVALRDGDDRAAAVSLVLAPLCKPRTRERARHQARVGERDT